MTPQQFIAKWQRVTLSERSACQQHFLDLCELLGQPKPAEADPEGTWYTFAKGMETREVRCDFRRLPLLFENRIRDLNTPSPRGEAKDPVGY